MEAWGSWLRANEFCLSYWLFKNNQRMHCATSDMHVYLSCVWTLQSIEDICCVRVGGGRGEIHVGKLKAGN